MRPEQPAFEQEDDPMRSRQQMRGVFRPALLDLPVANLALEFAISLQAVGLHRASRLNHLPD